MDGSPMAFPGRSGILESLPRATSPAGVAYRDEGRLRSSPLRESVGRSVGGVDDMWLENARSDDREGDRRRDASTPS
jgi:hypothetical protein